jgi:CDP-diacylglycerol--glycerol-3-phosphate 3-phosphatidyltransferase
LSLAPGRLGWLPNALSLLRIPFSLLFLAFMREGRLAFLFFLLAGLTDLLDGFFARRLGCASEAGARLDWLGDLVFFGLAAIWLVVARGSLLAAWLPALVAVAAIRVASPLLCWARNGRPYSIHTLANKAAGAAIFAGVAGLMLAEAAWPAPLMLAAGALSGLEELAIMAAVRAPDPDSAWLGAALGKSAGRGPGA